MSGEVGDLLAQAGGGTDVLIYVHGFNQTFETAALDAAQLSNEIIHGRTLGADAMDESTRSKSSRENIALSRS